MARFDRFQPPTHAEERAADLAMSQELEPNRIIMDDDDVIEDLEARVHTLQHRLNRAHMHLGQLMNENDQLKRENQLLKERYATVSH